MINCKIHPNKKYSWPKGVVGYHWLKYSDLRNVQVWKKCGINCSSLLWYSNSTLDLTISCSEKNYQKIQSSSLLLGFPGGSDGKESACNVGDPGLIPGSGRSPGEENANPLHYSCLESSRDRGASWQATAHRAAESDTTEQLSLTHTHTHTLLVSSYPWRTHCKSLSGWLKLWLVWLWFNPWSGKIPHFPEQLSLCATTTGWGHMYKTMK